MVPSLERNTVNQAATVADIRFRQVMDNLALMAASPGELPSYAAVGEGAQNVTDQINFSAATLWTKATFKGFSMDTDQLMYEQIVAPPWTLDPVFDQDQLAALHAAFRWAVFGPPPPDSKAKQKLDLFQVSRDLAKLPPDWLCSGKLKDVPRCALYKSHHKGTWVWVTPEGMEGLSAFTLIIQDIATVDSSKLNFVPPALDVKITFGKDAANGQKAPTLEATVNQDVRPWVVRSDDGTYNKVKAIVATPPPGMGLPAVAVFTLDPSIVLQTSQAPNADGTLVPPAPGASVYTAPSTETIRRS